MTATHDVIVIGGGAAGLMCALTAGRRGRRVAVLEHNERVGKKIAISGGGRCNFTNLHTGPGNYLSERPDFCRSALARFTPDDFLAMVEGHGIAYHEKTLGQQFCDTSSRAIVDMLLAECGEAGVEILCGCAVREISRSHEFELATNAGTMRATSLVVATGGLSFPKLGATDFGYRAARQFGLRITELRPGLVPLTLGEEDRSRFGSLSGVSLPVSVSAGGTTFSEALLFTHRGLSGPAILQASSYWQPGEPLHIDLLPGRELAGKSPAGIAAELGRHWPRRLVETWYHPPAKSHFTDRELLELSRQIHGWPPAVNGTEGYARAEVTLGGVDVGGLSSKTMEARDVRGLFFIGEVVDVTGWLGGYNFQWAWASGHAAGLAA